MQNRYAGDVGDFAKIGLLRAVAEGNDDGPSFRVGMHWYLVPDGGPAGDGRHIAYLEADGPQSCRACDPLLHRALRKLVQSGRRTVLGLMSDGVFPHSTQSFHEPLSFVAAARSARLRLAEREAWMARAYAALADCDIIFADPDNGLEVASTLRTNSAGPKYAFFDELSPFLQRGQSLIVYQHVNRRAGALTQAKRRLAEIAIRLPYGRHAFALRFRRFSGRFFFFVPVPGHWSHLRARARAMCAGTWQSRFDFLDAPKSARRDQ